MPLGVLSGCGFSDGGGVDRSGEEEVTVSQMCSCCSSGEGGGSCSCSGCGYGKNVAVVGVVVGMAVKALEVVVQVARSM